MTTEWLKQAGGRADKRPRPRAGFVRIAVSRANAAVLDGPFAETKEFIGGEIRSAGKDRRSSGAAAKPAGGDHASRRA